MDSVPRIVGTETISAPFTTGDGRTYEVTVTYGEDAGIPEGSRLKVTEVTSSNTEYDAYVEKTADAIGRETEDITYIKLLNIKITDKDGNEVEIAAPVDVQIRLLDVAQAEDSTQVVHFGETADVINPDVNGDALSFETNSFSIYAVVDSGGTGDNARLTVKFMNGESVIKTMYTKEADVTEDKLAQVIYDPGTPVEAGKKFMGWTEEQNYDADTTSMTIEDIRSSITTLLNSGVTEGQEKEYYAMMFKSFELYYQDEHGITFKTENLLTPSGDSITAIVNATYTADDTTGTRGFIGWAVAGTEEEEGHKVYKNGESITVSADTTLIPEIGDGHWLHFDENDGGAGVGNATYTPPAFVPAGETARDYEPDSPTRPGYMFAGWYTSATGGTLFDFENTELDSNTTVYARWTANEEATYKVVIWAQKVTDDKNAADSEKTYDYVNRYVLTTATGTQITESLLSQYMHYGNSDFGITDLANNSTGFRYRTFEILNGVGAGGDLVNSNNTTVVNVYYDRELFTVKLFPAGKGSNPNSNYSPTYTFTGLYGQPFSKYNYVWPSGYRWYSVAFLSSFNGTLFGQSSIDYAEKSRLGPTPNYIGTYQQSGYNTTIHMYVQDPDDPTEYTSAGTMVYQIADNGRFNIQPRFEGTSFNSYSWSTSASIPASWKTNTYNSGTTVFVGDTKGSNTHLHIRYDRVKSDIVFMYGSEEVNRVENIPNGKSLAEYRDETPEAPDDIPENYYFVGWYADPEGVNEVDWNGTMPLGNMLIYAVTKPVEYHVVIEPNGGTVDPNQSLNFWVPYGTVLDDTYFSQATKTVVGSDDHYSLVGWYLDEELTQPWLFSTKITEDSLAVIYDGPNDETREQYDDDGYPSTVGVFKLYAKWRNDSVAESGGIEIQYVNPKSAPEYSYTDPLHYADQADVIAAQAPTEEYWPTGEKFVGWKLGESTYNPGQIFIADSAIAERVTGEGDITKLVITLTAVYEDAEDLTPTHITWYKNDGSGEYYRSDEDLGINEAVDVYGLGEGEAIPSRAGYKFLGWAKDTEKPEGSDAVNTSTNSTDLFITYDSVTGVYDITKVAADEVMPYEGLYAVWQLDVQKVKVYKHETGDENKPLENAEFTLTGPDGTDISYTGIKTNAQGYLVWKDTETVIELPVNDHPYALTEVTPPTGYNIIAQTISFTINPDGMNAQGSGYSTGTEIDAEGDKVYVIKVANSAGVELPHTGGSGTLPYTLGGIALIMASALMYGFRMRRRERRLN